jgi:hypothetical protein
MPGDSWKHGGKALRNSHGRTEAQKKSRSFVAVLLRRTTYVIVVVVVLTTVGRKDLLFYLVNTWRNHV